MRATDFIYDGSRLSDFGFIICDFNSSSGVSISNVGCEIVFDTVQLRETGQVFISGAKYGACLTTTFCVCKSIANYRNDPSSAEISVQELRCLMTWLNRKRNCEFRILDEELDNIFFEGTFAVSRCDYSGRLIGLQLVFTSNRPYGLCDEVTESLSLDQGNLSGTVDNLSDDIGITRLNSISVKCLSDGDLDISNNFGNTHVYVRNCSNGETIYMDCKNHIVMSDVESHKIYNDFNFVFPCLFKTAEESENTITSSLPCQITIKYYPIAKIIL